MATDVRLGVQALTLVRVAEGIRQSVAQREGRRIRGAQLSDAAILAAPAAPVFAIGPGVAALRSRLEPIAASVALVAGAANLVRAAASNLRALLAQIPTPVPGAPTPPTSQTVVQTERAGVAQVNRGTQLNVLQSGLFTAGTNTLVILRGTRTNSISFNVAADQTVLGALNAAAQAINQANAGVTATVDTDRLVLTATTPGTAGAFTLLAGNAAGQTFITGTGTGIATTVASDATTRRVSQPIDQPFGEQIAALGGGGPIGPTQATAGLVAGRTQELAQQVNSLAAALQTAGVTRSTVPAGLADLATRLGAELANAGVTVGPTGEVTVNQEQLEAILEAGGSAFGRTRGRLGELAAAASQDARASGLEALLGLQLAAAGQPAPRTTTPTAPELLTAEARELPLDLLTDEARTALSVLDLLQRRVGVGTPFAASFISQDVTVFTGLLVNEQA